MKIETLTATITQEELEEIARLRREVWWHEKQLRTLEADAIALLSAGATAESGRYVPRLVHFGRKHTSTRLDIE